MPYIMDCFAEWEGYGSDDPSHLVTSEDADAVSGQDVPEADGAVR